MATAKQRLKREARKLAGGTGANPVPFPLAKNPVQATLNELIFQHGENLPEWYNYDDKLKEVGLCREQITQAMLEEASCVTRKRVREETALEVKVRAVPLCHLPLGARFRSPPPSELEGELIGLNECAATVRVGKNGHVESVQWSLMSLVLPVSKPPEIPTITEAPDYPITQDKENTMKATLSSLQRLGVALGKPAAKDWTAERALAKFGSREALDKLLEGAEEPTEKQDMELLTDIDDALAKGKTLEVVEPKAKAHEGNGKPTRKKAKPEEKKARAGMKSSHNDLPAVGESFTKTYKGKDIKVTVVEGGFKIGNKTYPSLTAAAQGVRDSESPINGWAFFGLVKKD